MNHIKVVRLNREPFLSLNFLFHDRIVYLSSKYAYFFENSLSSYVERIHSLVRDYLDRLPNSPYKKVNPKMIIENNSPSSSGGTSLDAMDLIAMKDVPLMMSTSDAETECMRFLGELKHLQNMFILKKHCSGPLYLNVV